MSGGPGPIRRQPAVRWWRLIPAASAAVVALAILAVRWSPVVHSHPAYLVTLLLVAGAGGALAATAVAERNRSGRGEAEPAGAPTSTLRTWVGRVAGVTATIVVVAALTYLRPLPASDLAVQAMAGTPAVDVRESRARISMRPTGRRHRTGLIFYPGALVDPRAYVPNLTAIAAAGYPVVVVKAPYNVALLDRGAARRIMDADRGVDRWVVAGHSLGGVAAASVAGGSDRRVRGLLLWASFPNGTIAGRTGLAVTSVSGSEDGLSTPAKIAASVDDLPPATAFVEVRGANHAVFGDYGTQSGDGAATTSRADAQRQIQEASIDLLNRVDSRR